MTNREVAAEALLDLFLRLHGVFHREEKNLFDSKGKLVGILENWSIDDFDQIDATIKLMTSIEYITVKVIIDDL